MTQSCNKHGLVLAAAEILMVADALCASATFQYDTAMSSAHLYFDTSFCYSILGPDMCLFAGKANASLHLARRRKRPPPVQHWQSSQQ